MTNLSVEIAWDQAALELFFVEVEDGLLPLLAMEVADAARALAPVRTRRTTVPWWARRGYVGSGGQLKASVMTDVGRDFLGAYADISALWYGRFLDPPARQMKRLHPFLPSALLWTLEGRDFYLG